MNEKLLLDLFAVFVEHAREHGPIKFSEARLNGLDLFSGVAGNALALRPWVKTVAYCERDKYDQAVILSRIAAGDIDNAPIWDDVKTLTPNQFDIPVDFIVAGFPCQDISVAGMGRGLDGERSGLVFEVFRLIDGLKPEFVFLENVPAIRTRGGERVVKEMATLGYDCRWDHLSAFDVGAPHKRERWFLLAHRNGDRCERLAQRDGYKPKGKGPFGDDVNRLHNVVSNSERVGVREQQRRQRGASRDGPAVPRDNGASKSLADAEGVRERKQTNEAHAESTRRETWNEFIDGGPCQSFGPTWWSVEPDVGRVAHGISARMDRLRGLGNAVVPAQAREAFLRLLTGASA